MWVWVWLIWAQTGLTMRLCCGAQRWPTPCRSCSACCAAYAQTPAWRACPPRSPAETLWWAWWPADGPQTQTTGRHFSVSPSSEYVFSTLTDRLLHPPWVIRNSSTSQWPRSSSLLIRQHFIQAFKGSVCKILKEARYLEQPACFVFRTLSDGLP